MKKLISIVGIIIVFFLLYFLQSNFFSWFTIAGIKPNLFVIFILFIGLFATKKMGLIFGFLFGIFLDIVIGKNVGISGIVLGIIGYLGECLDRNFSKESRITIMLMVITCTIIYETSIYIFSIFANEAMIEVWAFIKILLIETIYNTILVIILYPLLQKAGYYLENAFKNKNILTRYF